MTIRVIHWLPLAITAFCLSHALPLSSKMINNIFYAGIALPAVAHFCVQQRDTLWAMTKTLLAPLALILVISIIAAESLSDLKFTLYLFLFAISLNLRNEGKSSADKGLFFASLVWMVILSAITFHWAILSLEAGASIRYSQILGIQANPVHVALIIGTSIGFLWIFHLEPILRGKSTALYAVGFLSCVALFLLTVIMFQARSALVGLALFFVFSLYIQGKRAVIMLLVIAMGVTLAIALGADDVLAHRGLSYRPAIWQDAIVRLLLNCSLAWGCGHDDYLFAGRFPHPHSGYISVLYQTGVVGFSAFTLFALIFLLRGVRSQSRWLPVAMIGWGALITTSNGMFTSPSHPLWIYFWLPTLMCLLEQQEDTHRLPD